MDIDFSKLSADANAMVQADSAATPAPVETSPAPVAAPQAAPVVAPDPNSVPVAPLDSGQASPAEQKLTFDFGNGKVEQLTQSEVTARLLEAERAGLRQADYTRKTQEAARIKEEALAAYKQLQEKAQLLAQQEALYNNPQAMLAEAQRRVQMSQPIDPTQPMTVAQGIELARNIRQEFDNLQQARAQAEQAQKAEYNQIVEDRLAVANYAETINGTLNEVYTSHPILKRIPEMEQVMRYRVAQLAPESIEQTIQAFKSVAAELAKPYDELVKQQTIVQQAERAKLAAQGIEPPGGVAPQPAAQDYRNKDGRDLDWNRLKEAAKSM